MCVYCKVYLRYALYTIKMSLNTKEKETSLTPWLRITLWPCIYLEINLISRILDHSFQSQTVPQSKESDQILHWCLSGNFLNLWKGNLWLVAFMAGPAGRVNEPWICLRQDHSRQSSQVSIPKVSASAAFGEGRSRGEAQRTRSELSAIDNVPLGTTSIAGPEQGVRGIYAHTKSHSSFVVSHPWPCCRGSIFGQEEQKCTSWAS